MHISNIADDLFKIVFEANPLIPPVVLCAKHNDFGLGEKVIVLPSTK